MSEVLSQSEIKKIYGQLEDLESKVYKLKKELQYYTELNNGDITRIKKKYNNMSAEFSVSAEKIKAEVKEEVDGKLENYSTIEQTAEKITSEVNAKTDGLATKDEVTNLNSKIEQTAEKITSEVNAKTDGLATKDEVTNLNSKIEQTAEKITSEVNAKTDGLATKDEVTNLNSKIEQTKDSITMSVNSIKSDVSKELQTFESKVMLKDDKIVLDSNKTIFTSVLYLARKIDENNYENRFEFFYDNSQDDNYNQVFFESCSGFPTYINIGNNKDTADFKCKETYFRNNVYFYADSVDFSDCKSITWGNNLPTVTAVFG